MNQATRIGLQATQRQVLTLIGGITQAESVVVGVEVAQFRLGNRRSSVERFKIENFEQEHGVNTFPAFRSLASEEANHTLTMLKRRLELPNELNALGVLDTVDQKSVDVNGVDATEDAFDLRSVLGRLEFSAAKVFVNWYRFDRIDEFEIEDLCKYFRDIFYPSADDLEILDSNLTWLMSIRHYGAVKALRLS